MKTFVVSAFLRRGKAGKDRQAVIRLEKYPGSPNLVLRVQEQIDRPEQKMPKGESIALQEGHKAWAELAESILTLLPIEFLITQTDLHAAMRKVLDARPYGPSSGKF